MVIDSSAILAFMLQEVGAERVRPALRRGLICAINLAEVVGVYSRRGISRIEIEAFLGQLPCALVPVDVPLSYDAGVLQQLTASAGLSLGDRYCLALAARERLPVLTADRKWSQVADAVGVQVIQIR